MNPRDREILRSLAHTQLEWANDPKNLECREAWRRHGALQKSRPLVSVEIDTFEQEVVTNRLRCEDAQARRLERRLYRHFTNRELFDDDWVVPDYFPITLECNFHLFGQDLACTHVHDEASGSVAYQYEHPIRDLHDDYHLVEQPSTWDIDEEGFAAYKALAEDAFGDILPVRRVMNALYAPITQRVVHWMGMENMFFAMYDYPNEFHGMMQRMTQDQIAFFDMLEQKGLLLPTAGDERLWQGSRCFTDELPGKGPVKLSDVWGYLDSQESSGLSPAMYGEFIFSYYRRVAQRFGLLSYGCCEAVDPVWQYLCTLPNLRKVSISPWCNEETMGERLRGGGITYLRKPSPNFLGVGTALDEEGLRAHMERTARAACGCPLEFSQRDVYTIHHDPGKVRRYVQITRQSVERYYTP